MNEPTHTPKKKQGYFTRKNLVIGAGLFLFSFGLVGVSSLQQESTPPKTIPEKTEQSAVNKTKASEKKKKAVKKATKTDNTLPSTTTDTTDRAEQVLDQFNVTPTSQTPQLSSKRNPSNLVLAATTLAKEEKKDPVETPPVTVTPTTPGEGGGTVKPPTPPSIVNPPQLVESTPEIELSSPNEIVIEKGAYFNVSNYFRVTDALDSDPRVTVDTSNFDSNRSGLQTIGLYVQNKFGHTAYEKLTFFVNAVPVLTFTQGKTVDLQIDDTAFSLYSLVQATDEEDGDITGSIQMIENNVRRDKEGTYTVRFKVTDSKDSHAFDTVTVNVTNEAPVIHTSTKYHEINQPFDALTEATATDREDGTLPIKVANVLENEVDVTKEGMYQVVYQVTDSHGKASERVTQTVYVENQAPVILGLHDQTYHVGEVLSKERLLENVTVTDREDDRLTSPVTLALSETELMMIDMTKESITPLTVNAIDSMGKITSQTIQLTIVNDAPILHGIEDVTLDKGIAFDPLAGITATDTETESLSVTYTGTVDVNTPGTYELEYTVVDGHGKETTKKRLITVSDDTGERLVTEAKKYLGTPYSWGGGTVNGPSEGFAEGAGIVGFDCSSFVQFLMAKEGITLPRVTTGQELQGSDVSLNALEPGDLLFFGTRGATHHVAMYIGNDEFIHAPTTGEVIKITKLSHFTPDFAKRVIK